VKKEFKDNSDDSNNGDEVEEIQLQISLDAVIESTGEEGREGMGEEVREIVLGVREG